MSAADLIPDTMKRIVSVLFVAGLSFFPSPLIGQEATRQAPPEKQEKPRIEARFFSQSTPFAGEIVRGIIVAETNQFSFVVPGGFRQQIDPKAKKVTLISTNYLCAIVATLHEKALEGDADLKPDSLRQQVLARFKDAKITDEFTASIESMTGPAFEVEWPAEAGQMSTRAVFVPYPGGHFEITVQAPTKIFRTYDQALFQLLLSIRTSPAGAKLAVQEYLSEL